MHVNFKSKLMILGLKSVILGGGQDCFSQIEDQVGLDTWKQAIDLRVFMNSG